MSELAGLFGAIFGGILNIARQLVMSVYVILWGVWNFLTLLWAGGKALFGRGMLKDRLIATLARPEHMRAILAVLRTFIPTIVVNKRFVTAYDNSATAFVTAYEDVLEVMNLDQVFQTTYAPKMALLTEGNNFFLGMQEGPDYINNVSNMRLAANRNDIDEIITPFISAEIASVLVAAQGKLDVPRTLTKPVLARLVGHYFGTPGPSEDVLIDWTHTMFHYIFFDFSDEAEIVAAAQTASAGCRVYLDQAIAARQKNGEMRDDVLGRCLKLQTAEMPGMDNLGIRNNFLGMITAMLPTISNATTRVLDQLLARPEVLAGAQAAARSGDDELLSRYIVEAFRFNPMNPVIFRRAAEDHTLAAGTLRQREIPKGCFVFAANLSAMFDPWVIPSPGRFDLSRSPDQYILWGGGIHKCFGEQISRTVMPVFLKEILKLPNLKRASGPAGQMDNAGTPFPQHLTITFEGAGDEKSCT
ncbi:cytochrome P450 [Paremcibacter congregatus]|uniref:Cytochrome n=1 Tax=Paremcibacter congregatus TaxID=2043170 RepID=A0A2G4YND6_9PROT|nr:cytochrome P450 [Paremcibacter congregatus]PHZ83841.1 cytochrome [Paremcibacter congregatus]QDE27545.1 cytochrome P450 [Paremcibacter congregatus]